MRKEKDFYIKRKKMGFYKDETTVRDVKKIEVERFKKNMTDHFLNWKPLKFKHSLCCNTSEETVKWRKKQAIVLKYFLEHPTESHKSIERKFGCGDNYVTQLLARYPKIRMKIAESRDKEILAMYEDVLYDIAEITAKNVKAYKESDQQLRTNELKDLSSIAKDTNERKNLMEGKPTENQNITININ